ncbi:MAG: hypothetical protein LAP61_00415 [Acidobacteriia bacterium]|nr:hypothetical protein [Terriglobia bacterium]
MQFYRLVLAILGVWRVTHLLHAEDGPADLFTRLRTALGSNMAGRALDCFYCLSLWTALPTAYWLGQTWGERVLVWLATSAGAILLERMTAPRSAQATYFEDPLEMTEERDVQLR